MSQVELGSLFSAIRNGMNVKQDKSGSGIPISRIETISTSIIDSERVGYAGLTEAMSEGWLLEEGDILFSHINSVDHIGKCAVYRGVPEKLVHGMNLLCFRPDKSLLDPEFGKYLLRSPDFRSRLSNFVNKAVNQASVSIGNLRTIPVAAPPLSSQRRIAAILDQAESLRTQRRAALAQLDSLTQSIFLEMFGDALASTNRVAMGELVSEFRYGTSEKSGASGFPALRIPNIASGSLDLNELKTVAVEAAEFNRLRLLSGDLLFVRTNGNPDYVGRCAVFEPALVANLGFDSTEFIFASYLIRARLKGHDLLPTVLQYYLSDGEGRRALRARCKTSAGQYNINTEGLGAIPIPLFPPSLQQAFTTRIQAVESLKAAHRAALAELDALFASLQHLAFNGELTTHSSAATPLAQKKSSFAELGTLDPVKGLEALLYAARRLQGKGHYWATKAQYFADRRHLEHHGRTIYGETYMAMPHGPVPQAAFNASRALEKGELICEFPMDAVRSALRRDGDDLIALRDADAQALSPEVRESLDWAIRYIADMNFDQLKTASHDSAWKKTSVNAPIAWRDIIETLPEAARARLFADFE